MCEVGWFENLAESAGAQPNLLFEAYLAYITAAVWHCRFGICCARFSEPPPMPPIRGFWLDKERW